eukprot:448939_1
MMNFTRNTKNDIAMVLIFIIEGYFRNAIVKLPAQPIIEVIASFYGKCSWTFFKVKMNNKVQNVAYLPETGLWKSLCDAIKSKYDLHQFTQSAIQLKYHYASIPQIAVLDISASSKSSSRDIDIDDSKLVTFEVLNKALGNYYKSQGDSTYYSEPTPDGKFIAYCE